MVMMCCAREKQERGSGLEKLRGLQGEAEVVVVDRERNCHETRLDELQWAEL